MRTNATAGRLKRAALLALFFVSTGSAVWAQTPRVDHPDITAVLSPGMIAWITDPSGREEKVSIVAVSSEIVSTAVGNEIRHLRTTDVVRVRTRRSDSLLNGVLIGAGAAVGTGLFLCTRTEPWEICRDDVGPIFRIGAIGAGVGLAIDALVRGRKTIYRAVRGSARLHAAPILDRRAGGLQFSVSF